MRRTPSLEATEAFLAATRAPSFQDAAAKLALSPSAFSRRIQLFETAVGITLFDRSGPAPALTPAGRTLRDRLEPALDAMFAALAEARLCAEQSVLRIIASHSLALGWLMPRLADLYAECGIRVDLAIGRGSHHLRSGAVDLAIWGGIDDVTAYPCEILAELDAVPASSARLADGRAPPHELHELGRHALLHGRSAPNPWVTWLESLAYAGAAPKFVEMDNVHFACESAATGLGVVLASPLLADRQIREERLKPCFRARHRVPIQYKLVYAEPAIRRRADAKVFRAWLLEQIQESLQTFDRWAMSA